LLLPFAGQNIDRFGDIDLAKRCSLFLPVGNERGHLGRQDLAFDDHGVGAFFGA
jgi:hypothetical protein